MTSKTAPTRPEAEHAADPPPLFDVLGLDSSLANMATRPLEIWLRWQADILRAVEPASVAWLERRREGAATALEALEKLARCADLTEAAAVQRDWLDGAVRRLRADVAALTDQTLLLSQETVAALEAPKPPPAPAKRRTSEKAASIEAAA